MTDAATPALTLDDEIAALPPGSIYLQRSSTHPTDESFTVHARGVAMVASVEPLLGGTAWSVRVTDHLVGGTVQTATILGTQFRAAQQVIGMVLGYALALGVEATLPTHTDIRIQLA